ncbi:hypothetical protein Cfor_09807 [Coptotermes formosanus]|uniref:Ciliogenesis and planar polarity effector 2 n=1 Tax=Coptotermes formosanus TaxID=36987 RepID=A0A6L2Q5Q2_COPFO|nr:hypothetical protein Cfor_09807 [Coptotermes formosanus]
MNGCGVVSLDWQSSAEGETILQHFYDPQTTGRKVLGMCMHFLYAHKCRSKETRLYLHFVRKRPGSSVMLSTEQNNVPYLCCPKLHYALQAHETGRQCCDVPVLGSTGTKGIWSAHGDPHSRLARGILDRPSLPTSIEEVSYKLHITGRSCVGKTATVARLSGIKYPSTYVETAGIRKSNIFWPVKIWDKIILFKLQFWDAGDNSIKRYSHILPACRDKADAIVYVFSFLDNSSFAELPQQISRMSQMGENPAHIVIGTRYNLGNKLDVSSADIKEFELKWQVPVLKIDNTWSGGRSDSEVHEVASLLNIICERLWIRDQEYLLKQGLAR